MSRRYAIRIRRLDFLNVRIKLPRFVPDSIVMVTFSNPSFLSNVLYSSFVSCSFPHVKGHQQATHPPSAPPAPASPSGAASESPRLLVKSTACDAMVDIAMGGDVVEFEAILAVEAVKMAVLGIAAGGSIVDAVKESGGGERSWNTLDGSAVLKDEDEGETMLSTRAVSTWQDLVPRARAA